MVSFGLEWVWGEMDRNALCGIEPLRTFPGGEDVTVR